MKKQFLRKAAVLMVALALTVSLAGLVPAAVHAENFQFITGVKLASGEEGMEKLEKDGYSVRAVGLNTGVDADKQVYIGYKLNDGDPITNIIISADGSDSLDVDGIAYTCASKVDVDAGNGDGGGYVYVTTDEKAGNPLVALDILRSSEDTKLYPILNDGGEVVRHTDGTPADCEVNNAEKTIYLVQIRDGLIRPYICEVAIVEGEDKDAAVYTAASAGYNYYVDGDADTSKDTYTILAYDRTADVKQAITSLVTVSEELTKYLEDGQIMAGEDQKPAEEETTEEAAPEEQVTTEEAAPEEVTTDENTEEVTEELPEETEEVSEEAPEETVEEPAPEEEPAEDPAKELSDEVTVKMTAEAIDISGIEYDRISSNMIGGDLPCYMYMTKDEKAGNPITMLYVGDSTDITETTFGNWAYGYFTADGPSSANSYVVNEDLLEKFMANEAVYTRIPLALLSGKPDESATSVQLTAQPMQISLLTAKKGLPDDNLVLNGLRQATYEAPKMERNERNYEGDKNPASAFGDAGPVIIILGILAIAGAVYAAYVIKRRKARPLAEKENGDKEA